MRSVLLTCIVLCGVYEIKTLPTATTVPPQVVLLNYGIVTGTIGTTAWSKKSFAEFRGIKYAESPSGDLRFRPPVQFQSTSDEYNATENGRQCPTVDSSKEEALNDIEDCLHLSVFSDLNKRNQPVMVHIHGGGFYEGNAAGQPPYYMLEEDIVLVMIQYRLGPLGFYSTFTEDAPGNVAILDCIMALEWVQMHIEAFGGDPDSVTVFGQSAGAAIANVLTFSPLARSNLFHRIILQSGSLIAPWTIDRNPIVHNTEIAELANCKRSSIEAMNQCLRDASVSTILTAHSQHRRQNILRGQAHHGGILMVVGGPSGLLPIDPFDMWMSGNYRKNVSMLGGFTKHDGSFALATVYDVLSATLGVNDAHFNQFQLIDTINQIFGIDERSGSLTGLLINQLFTQDQFTSGNWSIIADGLIDLASIIMMKGPTLRAIQANARVNPNNTFLYTFDYEGKFTRFGYGEDTSHLPFKGGVHHSDDKIYLFPAPEYAADLNERDTQMAKIMVSLWTSFARDGIPSARNVPVWPPVNEIYGPYLHINKISTIGRNVLDEFSVASRKTQSSGIKLLQNNTILLLTSFITVMSVILNVS